MKRARHVSESRGGIDTYDFRGMKRFTRFQSPLKQIRMQSHNDSIQSQLGIVDHRAKWARINVRKSHDMTGILLGYAIAEDHERIRSMCFGSLCIRYDIFSRDHAIPRFLRFTRPRTLELKHMISIDRLRCGQIHAPTGHFSQLDGFLSIVDHLNVARNCIVIAKCGVVQLDSNSRHFVQQRNGQSHGFFRRVRIRTG